VTVPQVHELFSRLLRDPPPTARQIADAVTAVLRRNEEARIYHYHAATGKYPPRRPGADSG
jgi:hypothetical protein